MFSFFDWLDLSQWGFGFISWGVFFFVSFMIGLSKSGIPGINVLSVPLFAMILPPRGSVGVMLPMLMFGDLAALTIYWRYVQWRHVKPFIVAGFVGVALATLLVSGVKEVHFQPIIGVLVIVTIMLYLFAERKRELQSHGVDEPYRERPRLGSAYGYGFATGAISALANAGAPMMTLYLLGTRMGRNAFLATAVVMAMSINWIKVPFFAANGMITADTLKLNLVAMPVIVIGEIAGVWIAKRLPHGAFKKVILTVAFIAALKLISSLWF